MKRYLGTCFLGAIGFVVLGGVGAPVSVADSDPVAEAVATINQNFERDIRPLVNRSCVACHDSNAKPEGFLGVLFKKRELEHIRQASAILDFSRTFPNWSASNSDPVFFLDQIRAVIQQDKMPTWDFRIAHEIDGRLLKKKEKQEIIDWTVDSEKLLAQADSSRPTVAKLFSNSCLGCHNATQHSGGLVMTVSGGLLSVPHDTTGSGIPYLTPGNPDESAIYLVLLGDPTARKGLPAMPRNAAAFSDQERDIVYDWIRQAH